MSQTSLLNAPRCLISGTHSGSGKSFIALGLGLALRKRGLSVSYCTRTSSLSMAAMYRRISGRAVRNLDPALLAPEQQLLALQMAGVGADIVIIDGSDSLYDGWRPGDFESSDYDFLNFSKSALVLVADCRQLGTSLGALALGYLNRIEPGTPTGIIANFIQAPGAGADRDRVFYDAAMHCFNQAPLLGAVPTMPGEVRLPKNGVDQSLPETVLPRQFLVDLCTLVESSIDLDTLILQAGGIPSLRIEGLGAPAASRLARIAVSEDSCFGLCLQDNIDLLRFFGAEIVAFSPLADQSLPRGIHGIVLSGGCISNYAGELSGNETMRAQIKGFADAGGVIYAEGAGSAYLCDEFVTAEDKRVYQGAGVIPARAIERRGKEMQIVDVEVTEDSVLGGAGTRLRGLYSGDWSIKGDTKSMPTLRLLDLNKKAVRDGYSSTAQIVASFGFLHWGSAPEIGRLVGEACSTSALRAR